MGWKMTCPRCGALLEKDDPEEGFECFRCGWKEKE